MTLTLTIALLLAATARAATLTTLHRREHRQLRTLHRDTGTIRFFHRHRQLLHGRTRPVAVHAVRFARAELRWTRRELAQTRAERRAKISKRYLAASPRISAGYQTALASYYGPGLYGHTLACGGTLTTSLLGVANRTLACGTRLIVCYRRRCASATVVDRGPYIVGRDFDLTGGLAAVLGFGGVDTIRWAVTR